MQKKMYLETLLGNKTKVENFDRELIMRYTKDLRSVITQHLECFHKKVLWMFKASQTGLFRAQIRTSQIKTMS